MDDLWEQRQAEKEAARQADDEAVRSGRKTLQQLDAENYIFAKATLSFDIADQTPSALYGDRQ